MKKELLQQKVSSAMWAAYGDALGFPTELVDSVGLERRIKHDRIESTVPWQRMVGGKFGVFALLPAGAYSDDTQLRLCTSRSIREKNKFDVEVFSKIELTVWPTYALGGGRSSIAAALSLTKRSTAWFNNFYSERDIDYIKAGGNGVAMRIQPHVWASNLNAENFLKDVLKNAICTHGHPRALAGAVLHAKILADVLDQEKIPNPSSWKNLESVIVDIIDIVKKDYELSMFWLPTWEGKSGLNFENAIQEIAQEWIDNVDACLPYLQKNNEKSYSEILSIGGGLKANERGSGLKCALWSLCLAWIYEDQNPQLAISTAANTLGSDTDTIASMAGALLGAINPKVLPEGKIQDEEYIKFEAKRMHEISCGIKTDSFIYPDLLTWQPPQNQLDSVGLVNGQTAIAGLSLLKSLGEIFSSSKGDIQWEWFQTNFRQTILCKRRAIMSQLNNNLKKTENRRLLKESSVDNNPLENTNFPLPFSSEDFLKSKNADAQGFTINELTDIAIRSNFNTDLIGSHIIDFADYDNGIEMAIAYVAILVKARQARIKGKNK